MAAATVSLPQTAQAAPASTTSLPDLAVLTASLQEVPANLTDIARPVQVNGTLINMLTDGTLALRTASGTLTVNVQAAQADLFQSLGDTLNNMIGTNKPLTVLIQPGTPPTATVLVPKPELAKSALEAPPTFNATLQAEANKAAPFTKGQELSLAQMPDDFDPLTWLQKGDAAPLNTTKSSFISEKVVRQTLDFLQRNLTEMMGTQAAKDPVEDFLQVTKQVSPEKTAQQPRPAIEGDTRLRIDTILAKNVEGPEILAPHQLRATVLGRTPSGHAIIQVDDKHFLVKDSGQLPPGTRVIATPLQEADFNPRAFAMPDNRDWPAMREMMTVLTQIAPEAAQNFLQAKMPTPSQALPGTALFLLAALQSGKVEEWMGNPVLTHLTLANKKSLADRIVSDLSQATTTTSDTRVGEWKAYPFPIHHGQVYEQLHLYVRSDREAHAQEEERRRAARRTRFVITMNMTKLGPLQLDGLSQPKRLDLLVRSERELPPELPDELRLTYIKTLDALGLTGNIGFQTGRKEWIIFENEHPQTADKRL